MLPETPSSSRVASAVAPNTAAPSSLAERVGESWHTAVDHGREQIRSAAADLPRAAAAYVSTDPLKSLVIAAVVGAAVTAVVTRLMRW